MKKIILFSFKIILFVYLVTMSSFVGFGYVKGERDRIEMIKRYDALEKRIELQKKKYSHQQTELLFISKSEACLALYGLYHLLEKEEVPFSNYFTRVAVIESGWNLDSELASQANNLFGFICVEDNNRTIGCLAGHSKYASIQHCVKDLKYWINFDPPRNNEDFYSFIKRRGYNPYPDYPGKIESLAFDFSKF